MSPRWLSLFKSPRDDEKAKRKQSKIYHTQRSKLKSADDADIILRGFGRWPGALMYVHSEALQRSQYFRARLSARWNGEAQAEAEARRPRSVKELEMPESCRRMKARYCRMCIELMHLPADELKPNIFGSIEEALGILEVAAALVFDDCIRACMQYLDAVPWTSRQNEAIIRCLTSLHLDQQELAPRLFPDNPSHAPDPFQTCPPDHLVKTMVEKLAEITSSSTTTKSSHRNQIIKILEANIDDESLLAHFDKSMLALKTDLRDLENGHNFRRGCISAMKWSLRQLLRRNNGELAVKAFAEEKQLADNIESLAVKLEFKYEILCKDMLPLLDEVLCALCNGEAVVGSEVRFALLTVWLPVLAQVAHALRLSMASGVKTLEESLCTIIKTLPFHDQYYVFDLWRQCGVQSLNLVPALEPWVNKINKP